MSVLEPPGDARGPGPLCVKGLGCPDQSGVATLGHPELTPFCLSGDPSDYEALWLAS